MVVEVGHCERDVERAFAWPTARRSLGTLAGRLDAQERFGGRRAVARTTRAAPCPRCNPCGGSAGRCPARWSAFRNAPLNSGPRSVITCLGLPKVATAFRKSPFISAESGRWSNVWSAKGTREKASNTAAMWKVPPRKARTSEQSAIQTWWTKKALTGRLRHGEQVVRAEPKSLQGLDEAPDCVLHPDYWGYRPDGGADGVRARPNLGFPVADGVGADEKRARGLGTGPAEEALELDR